MPARCPQRVLVVEDQAAVAEFLRDALIEMGYSVALAATAGDGLTQLTQEPADLVVLDLGLPDVPGLDLLDRLHLEWPRLPVVILSGTYDPGLPERALARGAAAYITKPISLERLSGVLERVLPKRQGAGPLSRVIIAGGPWRTIIPGRWRVALNEAPAAAWRDRLLASAAADPEGAAMAVDVDGASIVFTTGETMRDQVAAIRVLYRLLREANRA